MQTKRCEVSSFEALTEQMLKPHTLKHVDSEETGFRVTSHKIHHLQVSNMV